MSGFHHEDVFCSTWTLQGCSNLFRTAAPRPWAAGSAHNNQDNAEQGCTSPYQQQQPKKTHFYVRNNFISLHFPNAKSPRAKSKLNKLSAPPVLIVSPAGWGNEGQNSAGPELCSGAQECQRIWDQKGEKHRFQAPHLRGLWVCAESGLKPWGSGNQTSNSKCGVSLSQGIQHEIAKSVWLLNFH